MTQTAIKTCQNNARNYIQKDDVGVSEVEDWTDKIRTNNITDFTQSMQKIIMIQQNKFAALNLNAGQRIKNQNNYVDFVKERVKQLFYDIDKINDEREGQPERTELRDYNSITPDLPASMIDILEASAKQAEKAASAPDATKEVK